MKIYYGDGKGKSTTAIGQAVMAASEGKNVIIVQFLKKKNDLEVGFLHRMEPEIKLFRFEKSDLDYRELTPEQQAEEVSNMRNGVAYAKKVLSTGECSVLILDEILGLLERGIIVADDLQQLKEKAGSTELILTGGDVTDEVKAMADELYCLTDMKH